MKNFYKAFALTLILFAWCRISIAQTNTFPTTGAAGIGTPTPNASSLLDITSTTKGVLVPRMTKTQRDAIATPATGLMIYQTNNTPGFYYYSGSVWKAVSPAGTNKFLSNLTAPTAVNQDLLPDTNNTLDLGSSTNTWRNIFASGNVGIGTTTPTAKLSVFKTPGIDDILTLADASNSLMVGTDSDMPSFIRIRPTSGTGLAITNNGDLIGLFVQSGALARVGVGTSAPGAKLDVGGDLKVLTNINFGAARGFNMSADHLHLGETLSEAATILGNAVRASGTINNSVAHTDSDPGNFIRLMYQDGISFHTNLTTAVNSNVASTTNERMRIALDGNVGIGTTTPAAKLHGVKGVSGATAHGNSVAIFENSINAFVSILAPDANETGVMFGIPASGIDGAIIYNNPTVKRGMVFRTVGATRMSLDSLGRLGIGTVVQTALLSVNGTANKPGGGSWAVFSDSRLKRDIKTYDDGLTTLLKIEPVRYHYNELAGCDTEPEYVGVIAQDLIKAAPYMVSTFEKDGKEYYSVDNSAMTYMLINAVKEQQRQIDEQKKIITAMQNDLSQCCMSHEQKTGNLFNTVPGIASMEQNTPNPFSENTIIRFYVPQSTGTGVIKIYSIDGSELKSIPVSTKGFGQAEISGKTLAAGTYTYMLLIDGKVVDTKQMVLTR